MEANTHQKTILNIDDSATIRRLVDSHLSQAGYHVVLAATAEEGLRLAREARPDLIILDHQLPGTTGFEVCKKLLELPETQRTPVVISSTLRKKAYAEYTEMSNVVDMLPKPYTAELLTTTVSNAIDTGSLIVDSQTQGTAVPEVIQELGDADLAGTFKAFDLRELLDFLNNGTKRGVVEVEMDDSRAYFYLDQGRIQAVVANGIDPREVSSRLPESLRDLAPVLNMTLGGRFCSEADGIVELLDNKVLDPRLLRNLLRHQAAVLVRRSMTGVVKNFRFEAGRMAPPLFRKLPLDISLLALLIEGALRCDDGELPPEPPGTVYVRRAARGQNLDRAGLSAQHMKVLSMLGEPVSTDEAARRLGCGRDEARRVLHGLVLADLVEAQIKSTARQVVALESDPDEAERLRGCFARDAQRYTLKIVRDRLALQLILKRSPPDAIVLALDNDECRELAGHVQRGSDPALANVKWLGIGPDDAEDPQAFADQLLISFDALVKRPLTAQQLIPALDRIFDEHDAEPTPAQQPEPELALAGHSDS